MAQQNDLINALWSARAFIREAIHEDADLQREVFAEVDVLLADLDPPRHREVIAEETAEEE